MIERLSANDLMELASDVGPLPAQVAGIVVLDEPAGVAPEDVRAALAGRLAVVPRLRQRLVRPPRGGGRPYWADAADVRPLDHVLVVEPSGARTDDDLLTLALELTARPLPRHRPLWVAAYVPGLTGGRSAVVLVLHHVVADGAGLLALLATLLDHPDNTDHTDHTDRAASGPSTAQPREAPSGRALVADAWRERWHSVRRARSWPPTVRAAVRELGHQRPHRTTRTSLNRPTGRRRHLAVVRRDLTPLLEAAHASSSTLNDVVLTAVGAALGAVLVHRGEAARELTASVPVSGRRQADAARLGNHVGVMPVHLPASGPVLDCLARVTTQTRQAKLAPPASSASLLQPVFRGLAASHLLRPFVDHQRLVTTFVTNVRGPDQTVRLLGSPVRDLVALPGLYGNITATFAVLSYAGALNVSVLVDPDAVPDHEVLTAALGRSLDHLVDAQRRSTSAASRPPDSRA